MGWELFKEPLQRLHLSNTHLSVLKYTFPRKKTNGNNNNIYTKLGLVLIGNYEITFVNIFLKFGKLTYDEDKEVMDSGYPASIIQNRIFNKLI